MKKILLVLLVLIAIGMIVSGILAEIVPPVLTGIGFIVISILFFKKE